MGSWMNFSIMKSGSKCYKVHVIPKKKSLQNSVELGEHPGGTCTEVTPRPDSGGVQHLPHLS